MNALRGVLLIWLVVVAPWILLWLTTMCDGYLSDVTPTASFQAPEVRCSRAPTSPKSSAATA